MNAAFPFVVGAVVLVVLTAYALVAVASEIEDYQDPAGWEDDYEG